MFAATFLLGEGDQNRKKWLENRLEELTEVFAIAVGGFSVLDNHLHVLVRLDPDVAEAWSDDEVVRRWGAQLSSHSAINRIQAPVPVEPSTGFNGICRCQLTIATARQRLQNLSWFMKCLKEPLSRLANRQDKVRGAFFEGRFKSVAVLDEEALLAASSV